MITKPTITLENIDTELINEYKKTGNLEGVNEWLSINQIPGHSNDYTSSTYIKGKFEKSIEYLNGLKTQVEKNESKDYNLLTNNCMQVTMDAFLKGEYDGKNALTDKLLDAEKNFIIPRPVGFDIDLMFKYDLQYIDKAIVDKFNELKNKFK